tara:strand:- start:29 stop:469 length:441 start_codon:yes stop_codon:yes gene_type:complete
MIKVKLDDIKKPTTQQEFQENLQKYYFPFGKDCLYVKPENGEAYGIPFSKIKSFSDIYELTNSGFFGDGTSPSIIPLVEEFSPFSLSGVVLYDSSTKESHSELFETNPKWFSLDNHFAREIYAKTLGAFSGYILPDQSDANLEMAV